MIIFVTNRKHNVIADGDLTVTDEVNGKRVLLDYVFGEGISELGFDLETTSLEPYLATPLLTSIGTKKHQFVFDNTSVNTDDIIKTLNPLVTWIGQNLKYDYSVIRAQRNIQLQYLYDVMIVEQRLYANMGLSNRLDDIVKRYTGFIPAAMNKNIREEFINANPSTFIFSNRHIEYSAGDTNYIFDVKEEQEKRIQKYGMNFLLEQIEFPLISVIAEMELEGLDLDIDRLRQIIKDNLDVKYQKECELDEEVRKLRMIYAEDKDVKYISSGKFDRNRLKPIETKQINIFDEEETVTSKKSTKTNANINYSSTNELTVLFGRLRFPLPTKRGVYIVPVLDDKNKVLNKYEEFTTQETALEQYVIDNPDSPINKFINLLIDYREVTTELNKYNEKFIKKINPATGRIHTIIRQCDAVNGRLQSGGGKTQPDKINIQNVPAKKHFRQLFYRKGYSIITIDLSGAEVVIMGDKANDTKIVDLTLKGDIHSHMAQTGWRNIFASRANNIKVVDEKTATKKEEYVLLSQNFIVSKKVNTESHRRPAKNLTFGSIYGCGDKKAAKTINVSRPEGRIYIDTIKSEIPLTFKMVEANVRLAFKQGYLILNERTRSRIWFPQIHEARTQQRELTFDEQHDIDGQARNVPISGTQADMIKEAMVVIAQAIKEQEVDCAILIQVHDELVLRCPRNMDGKSDEWKINPHYMKYGTSEVSFPEFVKLILCNTANKYLHNLEMGAELAVEDTWIK